MKERIINTHSFITARGYGMRVVGGKPGPDGTLYTYIVWTTPGGPAERARLRKGDKVKIH